METPVLRTEPPGKGASVPRRVVETHGITKIFSLPQGDVTALRDVNIAIDEGEFVSFVGPSGCGKSTLLNIVAGLLEPTAGEAMLYGEPIREPSHRTGFMFQTAVLLPWRTVEKNVLLPAEIQGLPMDRVRAKALQVIEAVGLKDFIHAYPKQLSGGMQQRVALARVLTYEPEVLLMDEPFGALDEFTREAMNLELMRITQSAGITCVFVTHNISEAVFLSDKVVVMTPRPGEVAGVLPVDLPRPREIGTMKLPAFSDLIFEVRSLLGKHVP